MSEERDFIPVFECPDCAPSRGHFCEVHKSSGKNFEIESVELADPKSNAMVTIVQPHGAEGRESVHDLLEAGLRAIAEAVPHVEGEWPEKYGTNYFNDVFLMRRHCWCYGDNCPSCSGDFSVPNFLYKPTGFIVTWYKYIGRSMEVSCELHAGQITTIISDCLLSISGGHAPQAGLEELKRFIVEDGFSAGCECNACILAEHFIEERGLK